MQCRNQRRDAAVLMQALLPQLSRGAAVVVNASNSALGGFLGGSVYGASKVATSLMAR